MGRGCRSVAVMVAVAACGRYDFESTAPPDSLQLFAVDAPRAVDAVVAMPDAQEWVCGDGVCDGSQGETCGACASDCDTGSDVCGNSECGSGETSTTCETDCGPSPWPFTAAEAALLSDINTARNAGITCPGSNAVSTPPQLTLLADPAALEAARLMAWEYAHDPRKAAGQVTCNGRTLQSLVPSGYTQGLFIQTSFDPGQTVTKLESDGSGCLDIENPAQTKVVIGAASDLTNGYILFLQ